MTEIEFVAATNLAKLNIIKSLLGELIFWEAENNSEKDEVQKTIHNLIKRSEDKIA